MKTKKTTPPPADIYPGIADETQHATARKVREDVRLLNNNPRNDEGKPM